MSRSPRTPLPLLLVPSLCALLAAALPAQLAKYQTYGRGCPGTGGGFTASNNADASRLSPLLSFLNPEYAIEVRWSSSPVVLGFEILTKSARSTPVTIQARLFLADKTGRPLPTPAAVANLTASPKTGWFHATFAKPVVTGRGPFFLSWSVPSSRRPSIFAPKTLNGMKARHYTRKAGSTGAWGAKPGSAPWVFRVLGLGPVAPWLEAQTPPRLRLTMKIRLLQAPSLAPALLITGVSNTKWGPYTLPLNLAAVGAGACDLLASYDLALPVVADKAGKALMGFPIPNRTSLIGLKFYQQWIVADPKANGLGMTLSFGGAATIGR